MILRLEQRLEDLTDQLATKPTTTKSAKKDKPLDSPDFILDNLVAPKFERAMKDLGVNYDAKIARNGKQHVKCKNEDRANVRQWCEDNDVHGTTSTCSHERIGASVAKGIPIDYTPEEVKDYLELFVDFKIEKVRRFAEPREGVICRSLTPPIRTKLWSLRTKGVQRAVPD